MTKYQVPVVGGLRKVIKPQASTAAGTTIAEVGSGTISLAQLAQYVSQLQAAQQNNTQSGGAGSNINISTGPGLSGGGSVGNIQIRLTAPIPYFPGEDGADGDPGPPGLQGAKGVNGATGPAGVGVMGPPGDDGADGDLGPPGGPGAIGAQGNPGPTGGVGPAGPAVYLPDDNTNDDGFCFAFGSGNATTTTGSTSSGNITPDTHPATENAQNDEFEYGTVIDTTGARFSSATAWSWVNQNGAITTVSQGSLIIQQPSSSGVSHNIVQQAVVGATWTYTCKVSAENCSGNSETGMIVGNSTGAFLTFDVQNNNLLIQSFTNPTTYGGSTYANFACAGAANGDVPWMYFQINFDGTNINFNFSTNGVAFRNIYSQVATTGFLGAAPSYIGLNVDNSSGTVIEGVFDWFRKTA